MKPQVYIDPRPAEFFDKYHERVRRGRPDGVYRIVRLVLTPPILMGYRFRPIDVQNVPERGPVLLAPNHFSALDHFFVTITPVSVAFQATVPFCPGTCRNAQNPPAPRTSFPPES